MAALPDCSCQACQDLAAECGSNFPWMRRKLLAQNWPGKTSPAERAYRVAHANWARNGKANLTASRFQKAPA